MSEGNDEKVKQGYWLFTAAGERQELREIFALNDIRPYCIQHEVNDNHDTSSYLKQVRSKWER